MADRRKFLKHSGIGLLGLFLNNRLGFSAPFVGDNKVFDSSLSTFSNTTEPNWNVVLNEFNISEGLSFLNNGTMGIIPQAVLNAVANEAARVNSAGKYGGGEIQARTALAQLMKVDATEIAMTHNVTEGINTVCWGLPLKKGDEIILSDQEHVGNAMPWINRADKDCLKIKMITLPPTADEVIEVVTRAITRKTKVLAIPHIPCTTGQVLPIKELAELARKNNIITVFDGAHGPGMLSMDLKDVGCDVYVSCCHKWLLGPSGTGFIYVSNEVIDQLEAHFVGGHSGALWELDTGGFDLGEFPKDAHRLFYGTQSASLYKGVEAAVQFHQNIGSDHIERRIKQLNGMVRDGLAQFGDRVEILTSSEPKSMAGVISFRILNLDNHKLVEEARKDKLILRFVAESGLDCIRVSTHIYNTPEDVERLLSFIADKLS
ncbi:MAG: cysteine desulfurase/selenocysteine lyase [Bacteroidia bacterium]|jgi:cysteine desulfurase/selenocysteine lyase